MRSLFVFVLWFIACTIGFAFLMCPWMIFVSFPRAFWHIYNNDSIHEHKNWEDPWFPIIWLADTVKKLDPSNRRK